MTEASQNLVITENKRDSRLNSWCVKDLVSAKLWNLFLNAQIGAVAPYTTIYLFDTGLTVSQVGYIKRLRTIFPFFIGPLFGVVADKTGRVN